MAAKLPNFVVTDGAATTTWEQTIGRPRVCLIGLKDVKCVIPGVFDLFEAVSNRMVSCSDGSASSHTSVTTNWTAMPLPEFVFFTTLMIFQ